MVRPHLTRHRRPCIHSGHTKISCARGRSAGNLRRRASVLGMWINCQAQSCVALRPCVSSVPGTAVRARDSKERGDCRGNEEAEMSRLTLRRLRVVALAFALPAARRLQQRPHDVSGVPGPSRPCGAPRPWCHMGGWRPHARRVAEASRLQPLWNQCAITSMRTISSDLGPRGAGVPELRPRAPW